MMLSISILFYLFYLFIDYIALDSRRANLSPAYGSATRLVTVRNKDFGKSCCILYRGRYSGFELIRWVIRGHGDKHLSATSKFAREEGQRRRVHSMQVQRDNQPRWSNPHNYRPRRVCLCLTLLPSLNRALCPPPFQVEHFTSTDKHFYHDRNSITSMIGTTTNGPLLPKQGIPC